MRLQGAWGVAFCNSSIDARKHKNLLPSIQKTNEKMPALR
jgi:hypothetical protein